MDKKTIGYFGEAIAKKYLENKGYSILATNWHFHHRELDLVAWHEETVVAIEVKTRKNMNVPCQTILKTAQVKRLRSSLAAFCQYYGLDYEKSRLDLITVQPKDKQTIIIKQRFDI